MFSIEQITEILSALPDPAFILTRSGRYAGVYGGTDSRYYHDGSSLVGQTVNDVLQEDKASWFLGEIEQALQSKRLHVIEYGLSGSDVKGLDDDGPDYVIWFEGRVQALNFQVDNEDAVLWVASNITERHNLEEQLRSQSETDELTGLHNRRYFDQAVSTELNRARRYHEAISLFIFDADHFKTINDTQGHKVGDAVLREIASLITSNTRESDIVVRWGGEEFLVLMPHTSLAMAEKMANIFCQSIEAHHFKHDIRMTISIGVAEWALESESVDELISRADEALYDAKHAGRNCVVCASQNILKNKFG